VPLNHSLGFILRTRNRRRQQMLNAIIYIYIGLIIGIFINIENQREVDLYPDDSDSNIERGERLISPEFEIRNQKSLLCVLLRRELDGDIARLRGLYPLGIRF
jgi:hypothetical protein